MFIPEGSNVVDTVWWVLRRSSLTGIYLGRGRFLEVSFLVVIWSRRAPLFALSVSKKSTWDVHSWHTESEVCAVPFISIIFGASRTIFDFRSTLFKKLLTSGGTFACSHLLPVLLNSSPHCWVIHCASAAPVIVVPRIHKYWIKTCGIMRWHCTPDWTTFTAQRS